MLIKAQEVLDIYNNHFTELYKAKYKERWKGADGKWQYRYYEKKNRSEKGEKIDSVIEAISKERYVTPQIIDKTNQAINSLVNQEEKADLATSLDEATPQALINKSTPQKESVNISKEQAKEITGNIINPLKQSFVELTLDQVTEEEQIRKSYDPEVIQRIAETIMSSGLQQPIQVRYDEQTDKYKVIAGHTRLRAIKKLIKEGHLPPDSKIMFSQRNVSDSEKDVMQIIENEVRSNNTPLEVSDHYAKLISQHGKTANDISELVGIPVQRVKDYLQIQNLNPDLRNMLKRGEINKTAAIALGSIDDHVLQSRTFGLMLRNNWNTVKLKNHIRGLKTQQTFFSQEEGMSEKQRLATDQLKKEGIDPNIQVKKFQNLIDRHQKFVNQFLDQDGARLSNLGLTATGDYESKIKQLELVQKELNRVMDMMQKEQSKMMDEPTLFKAQSEYLYLSNEIYDLKKIIMESED